MLDVNQVNSGHSPFYFSVHRKNVFSFTLELPHHFVQLIYLYVFFVIVREGRDSTWMITVIILEV